MPPTLEDFPYEVQVAFFIYGLLPDIWVGMSGSYQGKDWSPLESLYNISNSEDLFTNVVHRTLGGHLPMVLQLDKDVFTPESFAIVRLDSDFSITQKNPNLYNIKMKLVEQI